METKTRKPHCDMVIRSGLSFQLPDGNVLVSVRVWWSCQLKTLFWQHVHFCLVILFYITQVNCLSRDEVYVPILLLDLVPIKRFCPYSFCHFFNPLLVIGNLFLVAGNCASVHFTTCTIQFICFITSVLNCVVSSIGEQDSTFWPLPKLICWVRFIWRCYHNLVFLYRNMYM